MSFIKKNDICDVINVIYVVDVISDLSLWLVLTTYLTTLMTFIKDTNNKISFDASTII